MKAVKLLVDVNFDCRSLVFYFLCSGVQCLSIKQPLSIKQSLSGSPTIGTAQGVSVTILDN